MASGSRRSSPKMTQPRTYASSDAPRHTPRIVLQNTHIYTQIPNISPSYQYVPVTHSNAHLMSSCMPIGDDAFYSGNDGSYIPATNIAPAALTFLDSITPYDIDTLSSTSSSSISGTIPSPPTTEAELFQNELFATTDIHPGQFVPYHDPWVAGPAPPTPPEDFLDIPDMFCSSKADSFQPLPEPATECEYLGVSSLQFARNLPRNTQPRPIRSASERTPPSSASGSPKDEPLERTRNNPRGDHRYDAKPDIEGYYHCPYASEGPERCQHKKTKQKCIYAKNLDSHLKPYTCKYTGSEECRTLRFSSNACLFRHEREMHGLHNHGMNPYLCLFPGCERARHDNGFPRRWNQRDHMKRVHGWEEPKDNEVERSYSEPQRRKRGHTATGSVPMKRNGSARSHPYLQGQPRNTGAPRYTAPTQRELQAPSHMTTGIVDPSHYSAHPMMGQSYAPLYMSQY